MTTTLTFAKGAPAYQWDALMGDLLSLGTWVNFDGTLFSAHLRYNELSLEVYGPMELQSQDLSGGPVSKMVLRDGTTTIATWNFTHYVDALQIQVLIGNTKKSEVASTIATLYGGETVLVQGSSAYDLIHGGAAHDVIVGRKGSDSIDGGGGLDEVRYSSEGGSKAVYVNLSAAMYTIKGVKLAPGEARDTYGSLDTLSNIESVTGTKRDDYFVGPSWWADPDAVVFFSGGRGKDTIIGGSTGIVGVRYDDAAVEGGKHGVIVNLTYERASGVDARSARDTYGDIDTIKGVNTVVGSRFGDKILGSGSSDKFWGGAGKDTIKGNSGSDYLHGGSGNDTLNGGYGADTLVGGKGRDVLEGGSSGDQFVFSDLADSRGGSSSRDYIRDFKPGTDKIVFENIDADTTLEGLQAFIIDGKVSKGQRPEKGHINWYWVDKSGKSDDRTIIRVNVDDNPRADMEIELKGLLKLSAGDFIV